MNSKPRLIELNVKQKEYYESKALSGSARNYAQNLPTYLWAKLRYLLQKSENKSGVKEAIIGRHRQWLGDISDKHVLDLGCFSGNRLSVDLARSAKSYLGIDLSARAIDRLNRKLDGIPTAEAKSVDFLEAGYRDRFDVIYAHGVLHHFDDFDLLCAELHSALRPGGVVISLDPLQLDPINRFARWIYRPFQSDKEWEWPFTQSNFEIIREYFSIESVQGFRGFSRLGFLAGPWGGGIARWGCEKDLRHANRFGLPLSLCWLVTMKLRKSEDEISLEQ